MIRILILVENRQNRRLLAEYLCGRYEIIPPECESLDAAFDLCIVDGIRLERLSDRIEERRQVEHPVFLPFLFLSNRQDASLLTRYLWRSIDELIFMPVEKMELQARVEILRRARDLSRALENRYRDKLRALASELVLAEERERKRVATDLHDTVAQMLALARLRMNALTDRSENLEAVRGLLDQGVQQVRALMADLSPWTLQGTGLEEAMLSLVKRMERQHGLVIGFSRDGCCPLPRELSVLLLRSVQELLVNVVKHARAGRAEIDLVMGEANVRIEVSDDGTGFDPAAAGSGDGNCGGFGLFSIGERLEHLGGRLEIESAPGRGTRVRLVVPLPN